MLNLIKLLKNNNCQTINKIKYKQLSSLTSSFQCRYHQINRNYSTNLTNKHTTISTNSILSSLIDIKADVLKGLNANGSIVALESTIITHGMPYPYNFETAMAVEDIVRNQGAIPATIAIINGRIKVGLTINDLELLAKSSENVTTNTIKTSRRDLAYVLSKKWNGGTTVAGTLFISNLIGINVFATGGIGGVHRNGNLTMDISADLIELGKSAVAVISSGVKSILDIEKTLEYLETQGVCVASYQCNDKNFPAFYTRESGVFAPYNFNTPEEIANVLKKSLDINLQSGFLIGVPVPIEFSMNQNVISTAIDEALKNGKNISGKEITPYLLSAIAKITDGKSLETNIALIKNNAKVAADIAIALSDLKQNELNKSVINKNEINNKNNNSVTKKSDGAKRMFNKMMDTKPYPVVVGGSMMDSCYSAINDDFLLNGLTHKAKLKICAGGVARNITEGLCKLYGGAHLISMIGNDFNGEYLKNILPKNFQNTIEVHPTLSTANCAVLFDKIGDCIMLLGAMDIHGTISPEMIIKNEQLIAKSPILIMDGNLSLDTMGIILEICQKYHVPVFFEPTDALLAGKPFQLPIGLVKQIKFISPNVQEFLAITKALNVHNELNTPRPIDDQLVFNAIKNRDSLEILQNLRTSLEYVNSLIDTVIVTLGSSGVLIVRKSNENELLYTSSSYDVTKLNDKHRINTNNNNNIPGDVNNKNSLNKSSQIRYYPVNKLIKIVNVTGAGDSFACGFIVGMLKYYPENLCVSIGFQAAECALKSEGPVADQYFDETHNCWTNPKEFNMI